MLTKSIIGTRIGNLFLYCSRHYVLTFKVFIKKTFSLITFLKLSLSVCFLPHQYTNNSNRTAWLPWKQEFQPSSPVSLEKILHTKSPFFDQTIYWATVGFQAASLIWPKVYPQSLISGVISNEGYCVDTNNGSAGKSDQELKCRRRNSFAASNGGWNLSKHNSFAVRAVVLSVMIENERRTEYSRGSLLD